MEYDVVVRNGVVVDGIGAPRYRADVAIKDRKIAALIDPGDAASASAAREIDATGLAIAPGFIDMHSNSDGSCRSPITRKSQSNFCFKV